jgi:hypothetical protein
VLSLSGNRKITELVLDGGTATALTVPGTGGGFLVGCSVAPFATALLRGADSRSAHRYLGLGTRSGHRLRSEPWNPLGQSRATADIRLREKPDNGVGIGHEERALAIVLCEPRLSRSRVKPSSGHSLKKSLATTGMSLSCRCGPVPPGQPRELFHPIRRQHSRRT